MVPAGTASIRFTLTGPVAQNRTENVAPYTLFGDSGGDFAGEVLLAGTYALLIEAFSEADAGGQALASVSVNFTVSETAALIFSDGFE